jgi:hypothetical protein
VAIKEEWLFRRHISGGSDAPFLVRKGSLEAGGKLDPMGQSAACDAIIEYVNLEEEELAQSPQTPH